MRSMTGFASLTGDTPDATWAWELRSVNAKGLDIRVRLPEGFEVLDASFRDLAKGRIARGNVSLGLRLKRQAAAQTPVIKVEAVQAVLRDLHQIEDIAARSGAPLAPVTAVDILQLPGVSEVPAIDNKPLLEALKAQQEELLSAFLSAREDEGRALSAVLDRALDEIAQLVIAAKDSAEARQVRSGELLRARVAALVSASDAADDTRIEQELALLAVKADVTEEIDRLNAHVASVRELMRSNAPIGRKFDFLMQEFNREANTLCSKSGSTELTNIGLSLKVLIDQMREQVQNVE